MLKVFVGIFMSFSTKLASLYHVDQHRLDLKSSRDLFAITSNVGVQLRAVESPKAEVVG
jgi:hypothetical protein